MERFEDDSRNKNELSKNYDMIVYLKELAFQMLYFVIKRSK